MPATRDLSPTEVLAVAHPPMINPSDIVSAKQYGATTVYLVKPAQMPTPQQQKQRNRRLAEISWGIIDHMRELGIDV